MSIGYDLVSPRDFNNYWSGCTAYKYDKASGEVSAWHIIGIEEEDEHNNEYAIECSCALNRYGRRGIPDTVSVTCDVLFSSPEWIIHRFALGYVPVQDTTLVYISAETDDRRMRKGTSLGQAEFQGLLFREGDDQACKDLPEGLVTRVLRPDDTPSLADGIAKVLSYGNNPSMRRNISRTVAMLKSNDAVKKFFNDRDAYIVVPNFDTALVKTTAQAAILLYNGKYLGHVRSRKGATRLTVRHTEYPSEGARELAQAGITDLIVPMVADSISFS